MHSAIVTQIYLRVCALNTYMIVNLIFPFWAAAPEGQMTYDSTQGDFLRFPYVPPNN